MLGALGNSDGVARLPSALAAFFTRLLAFDLGRRVASPLAGLSALLALTALPVFFRSSHNVLVDPMLTLFVLLGFYAYVRAALRSGNRHDEVSAAGIFGIYLAAALAFYVKGLVGILAIAGPIAGDVLLFRRFRVLRSAGHLAGLPLLLAVCASWTALLHAYGGDAAVREFLLQNGLYRIAPGASLDAYRGGHVQPFWYYLEQLPGQLTWWIALVPGVAAWVPRAAFPPCSLGKEERDHGQGHEHGKRVIQDIEGPDAEHPEAAQKDHGRNDARCMLTPGSPHQKTQHQR